jgi:transducin (beta)-like 1
LWGLWDASSGAALPDGTNVPIDAVVMPHSQHIGERYKDVTSVNWSPDGKHLATGCYDGVARVWTALGNLEMELHDHNGPVFSLKWSKDGQFLLSGSYDRRSIIWNPVTGKAVKTYHLHSAPVLDVDWSDSDLFATCSSDRTIYICKVSTPDSSAIRTLVGHEDEVNSVSWSPGGQYLASCSDDSTAKVSLASSALSLLLSLVFFSPLVSADMDSRAWAST